jgi:hypothetical protein
MRVGYGLQEESVRFLGLHIDENLDWRVHISNVVKKISKGSYLLWRHKKKLNIQSKKQIYESFIRSHILYCLSVWGAAIPTHMKPLNKAVMKALKQMGPYKQHTLNRLQNLGILKIEDELILSESKTVWRWVKNKIPSSLKSILIEKPLILRNRHFETSRNAKSSSIETRLAKLATSSIASISTFKTKKSLSANIKSKIIANKYSFRCIRRDCFICTR